MTIFSGGYDPSINTGLMNLQSVKQMLFCIAQDDGAAMELDAFTILGISGLLGDSGYQIEQAHDKVYSDLEALKERHSKLRADIAALKESGGMIGKSDLAQILEADQEVNHAI